MRERLQNMERKKQVQDTAARQMEALRKHIAEREAAAKIKQGAHFENLNTYFNSNNTEVASSPDITDEALLAEHESRWATIEAAAASIHTSTSSPDLPRIEHAVLLTFNTVPWSPFGQDFQKYLLTLSRIGGGAATATGNRDAIDSTADLRRAYTRACLRWHPDKFQHKFGRLLDEKDYDLVMSRIQEIAGGINQAWQELRQDP